MTKTVRKSYSHTKRSMLEKCPRLYFYEYYARARKGAPGDRQRSLFGDDGLRHAVLTQPEIEQCIRLRELKTAPMHTGQILHALIAQSLRKPDWSSEWFIRNGRERFNAGNGTVTAMVERWNQLADAEERIQQAERSMVAALKRFFEQATVRSLVEEMRSGEEILIERPIGGLPPVHGFTIQGWVDFCSRTAKRVEVVDWKMGRSVGDEDSLQLALYGIWAAKHFSVKPEEVRIRRVYLGDGVIEEARRLNQRLISRAEARLHQDVERMADLHPYGQAGHVEAFTPKPRERVCEMCKFRTLCPAAACSRQ